MGDELQTDYDRLNARLTQIERNIARVSEKLDRVLIGDHSSDGLLGQMARLDERHRGLRAFVAWLTLGVTALAATLAPGWFKAH